MIPGAEDFQPGRSPVRDLTLLEQIAYWQERAQLAEELAHKYRELVQVEAETETEDAADWWKEA